MILDLGCGGRLESEDAVGVDVVGPPDTRAQVICNLGFEPIPVDDNSCELVVSHHFIEHVPFAVWYVDPDYRWRRYLPIVYLMNEVYRVLQDRGVFKVTVPLVVNGPFPQQAGFQDITHVCYSDDTEVLTESGFKLIADVQLGERVHTLDYNTGRVSLSECVTKFDDPYDGKLVHFKTRVMDILVTPNHRMLTGTNNEYKNKNANWKMQEARELLELKGHHSRRAFTEAIFSGDCPDTISIPRVERGKSYHGKLLPVEFQSQDFMEFIGWFLSEGSLGIKEGYMYQVNIHQSPTVNPDKYERIWQLVSRMGFSASRSKRGISFHSKDMCYYLKPLGDSYSKYIPVELKGMHPNLLQIMLNALILGDGRKNGNAGAHEYASVSKQLADDVQEIAIKCGHRTTIFVEKRNPIQFVVNAWRQNCQTEMYIVGIAPAKVQYYPRPTLVDYSGFVHCIEVAENNIILVRRNGRVLWSGNSFWTPETTRYLSGDYYGFHEVYGHKSRFQLTKIEPQIWFMRFELTAIKDLPEDYPYLLEYEGV